MSMSAANTSLEWVMSKSIREDYYFAIVVTSHTQATLKSEQMQFGVGKTTCAMQWMIRANHPHYHEILHNIGEWAGWKPPEDAFSEEWNKVFDLMAYNPCDVREKFMVPGRPRINMCMWDDVPYTCPRTKGVPKFITLLKGELTAARPEIAVLIMTTPNRLDMAAPLRALPNFEIIVPRRGVFEVQRTIKMKNFKDPEFDLGRLVPVEKGRFSALPDDVQKRYNKWRIKQKDYTRTRNYAQRLKRLTRDASRVIEESEDDEDYKEYDGGEKV